jgi:hypothetical protein
MKPCLPAWFTRAAMVSQYVPFDCGLRHTLDIGTGHARTNVSLTNHQHALERQPARRTALHGEVAGLRAVQQRVSFETKNRPYEIKGLRVPKVGPSPRHRDVYEIQDFRSVIQPLILGGFSVP